MNIWDLADGSKLVLLYHSPEEWAEATRSQLVALGCSPEYAERRAGLIRTAVPGSGLVRGGAHAGAS